MIQILIIMMLQSYRWTAETTAMISKVIYRMQHPQLEIDGYVSSGVVTLLLLLNLLIR